MVPICNELKSLQMVQTMLTNVDMGLVTGESSIVPYAVHVSAGALHSQRILNRVDATLVAGRAHKHS
jgi:hypothetical protein